MFLIEYGLMSSLNAVLGDSTAETKHICLTHTLHIALLIHVRSPLNIFRLHILG